MSIRYPLPAIPMDLEVGSDSSSLGTGKRWSKPPCCTPATITIRLNWFWSFLSDVSGLCFFSNVLQIMQPDDRSVAESEVCIMHTSSTVNCNRPVDQRMCNWSKAAFNYDQSALQTWRRALSKRNEHVQVAAKPPRKQLNAAQLDSLIYGVACYYFTPQAGTSIHVLKISMWCFICLAIVLWPQPR